MSRRKQKTKIPKDIQDAIDDPVIDNIVTAITGHLEKSEKENVSLIYASLEKIVASDIANGVLKKLEEKISLPIGVFKKILKCEREDFVPKKQKCFEILINRATSQQDGSALKIIIEQLNASYPRLLLSFLALRRTENTIKELMKTLIQKKPEIILRLLRSRYPDIRTNMLDLLMELDNPHLISLDMVETAFHSENQQANLIKILKLSDLINPFDTRKETVFVNTPYLVNWCINHYFGRRDFTKEIHIHCIIDELIKKIV
ncbi:MAG: hypothetical protein QW279_13845, partial [Candidatus Jordarchaeaceae archaeon]